MLQSLSFRMTSSAGCVLLCLTGVHFENIFVLSYLRSCLSQRIIIITPSPTRGGGGIVNANLAFKKQTDLIPYACFRGRPVDGVFCELTFYDGFVPRTTRARKRTTCVHAQNHVINK